MCVRVCACVCGVFVFGVCVCVYMCEEAFGSPSTSVDQFDYLISYISQNLFAEKTGKLPNTLLQLIFFDIPPH